MRGDVLPHLLALYQVVGPGFARSNRLFEGNRVVSSKKRKRWNNMLMFCL